MAIPAIFLTVKTFSRKVIARASNKLSFNGKTELNGGKTPLLKDELVKSSEEQIKKMAEKFGVETYYIPENLQAEIQMLAAKYKDVATEKLEEFFLIKHFDRLASNPKTPRREHFEHAILKGGAKYIKFEDILGNKRTEETIKSLNAEDVIDNEITRIVRTTFKKANSHPKELTEELEKQKKAYINSSRSMSLA